MYNPVRSILRASTRKEKSYNILFCSAHSPYDVQLSKCGHRWYCYQDEGVIPWNPCRNPPNNLFFLERGKKWESIPKNVDFDFVFSSNPEAHFPHLIQYARAMHLPIIQLFHTMPPVWNNNWQQYTQHIRNNYKADIQVAISEYSRDMWGFKPEECEVIHHACDTDFFMRLDIPREDFIMYTCNMLRERDFACGWRIWESLRQGYKSTLVGNDPDPNYAKPIQNPTELNIMLNRCSVYVNCSTQSPIPYSLIESALAECPIVSTASTIIPEVFNHKESAMLFPPDRIDLGRKYIQWCLDNPEEAIEMGKKARLAVLEFFDAEKFRAAWNDVFDRAASIPYKGF